MGLGAAGLVWSEMRFSSIYCGSTVLFSTKKARGAEQIRETLRLISLSSLLGKKPVLRIRIHRIHMFLGLLDPDPDPLVRGMDPDPDPDHYIIKQK